MTFWLAPWDHYGVPLPAIRTEVGQEVDHIAFVLVKAPALHTVTPGRITVHMFCETLRKRPLASHALTV
jgi:hypothetical protein